MKAHSLPGWLLLIVLGLVVGCAAVHTTAQRTAVVAPPPLPPPMIVSGEPLKHGVQYEIRSALAASDAFDADHPRSRFLNLGEPPPKPEPEHPRKELAVVRSSDHDRATVRTTAYSHLEDGHRGFGRKSAIGSNLKYGEVCSAAADWSRYPVGTKFRITSQPGVTYVVDDYGSAVVGSGTIDLYRPTISSMNDWGTRRVNIEVIEWGSYKDSLRLIEGRTKWDHVSRMYANIKRRLHGDEEETKKAKASKKVKKEADAVAAVE